MLERQDRWLRRLSARVRDYAKMQDRAHVLSLSDIEYEVPGTGSSLVRFGTLAASADTSLELWLRPGSETAIATREIRDRPLTRDLGAWFMTESRATARRLSTAAERLYGEAAKYSSAAKRSQTANELHSQAFLFEADDASGYGLKISLTVPSPDREPVGLLIADLAYFFVQISRVAADLQPYTIDPWQYSRAASPGELISFPGPGRPLSMYRCPQCRHALRSDEAECDRCEWRLHTPSWGRGANGSKYEAGLDDT